METGERQVQAEIQQSPTTVTVGRSVNPYGRCAFSAFIQGWPVNDKLERCTVLRWRAV